MAFEDDVRRVAEALWGLEPGECQPHHYSDNLVIRELDGIARLRDISHVLMVTTSTKLTKVQADVKKVLAAAKLEANRKVPVSMWLITETQLDAQHIRHANQNGVTVLTLEQFRNRFLDGRAYIEKRWRAAFGSARNLSDGSITIPENEYIPLPMQILEDVQPAAASGRVSTTTFLSELADRLEAGEIIVLSAPFGSGKSLTTRELFFELGRRYKRSKVRHVPVTVNLREHWGASYGDEVLERHARSIGFTPKEDLTIAWRAGLVTLMLDGFDEMAGQVVARSENVDFLREVRYQALASVRDLVAKAPAEVGILLCGRNHYFDSLRELAHALALTGKKFSIVTLGEFTEQQAGEFLRQHDIHEPLPDWLPRKPLLLGYLAHRGLLVEILGIDAARGFGHAWDTFLTLVCEREAEHERAMMDPLTLRHVMERLSCAVRSTVSGSGPITGRELAEAYRLETGQIPGEAVLMQLQRLPGLTERDQDPGTRSFVDPDMLAALQGSAIARVILEDFQGVEGFGWLGPLSPEGIAAAAFLARRSGATFETVLTRAAVLASNAGKATIDWQLTADIISIALEMAGEEALVDCRGLYVESAHFGRVDLENTRIDGLTLRDCIIDEVVLGSFGIGSQLRLDGCHITKVNGVASEAALPQSVFGTKNSIEHFDDMSTNNAVLALSLPPQVKALITILRKLYLQPGSGRKRGALNRGLPSGPVLDSVEDVLDVLEAEGVIGQHNDAVHPVRRQAGRIRAILQAPMLSEDPIVRRVMELT